MDHNYKPGKHIKDGRGFEWLVMETWTFDDYICMTLRGRHFPDIMGGHRVNLFVS